jgi:hypothetical protein
MHDVLTSNGYEHVGSTKKGVNHYRASGSDEHVIVDPSGKWERRKGGESPSRMGKLIATGKHIADLDLGLR